MELAAALTDKAHSVSVIGIESVPFKNALGEKVGKAIMKVGWKSAPPEYYPHYSHYGKKKNHELKMQIPFFLVNSPVTTRECKSSHWQNHA